MKTTYVPVDSEILGGAVLSIDEFSAAEDFAAFEAEYVAAHRPVYVSCKVPLERVHEVHVLEAHGFRLIECQIRSRIDFRRRYDTSAFPFRFEEVTARGQLGAVLDIAAATFQHDRFTKDPEIPRDVPARRHRRYVEASFERSDQAVYRLFDPESDRTVAFKTHRYLPGGEVQFLLGGVAPDLQHLGLGVVNAYSELNVLHDKGCRFGITQISAANYHVFNVEIGKLGFRVVTTFATMRKLYPRGGHV